MMHIQTIQTSLCDQTGAGESYHACSWPWSTSAGGECFPCFLCNTFPGVSSRALVSVPRTRWYQTEHLLPVKRNQLPEKTEKTNLSHSVHQSKCRNCIRMGITNFTLLRNNANLTFHVKNGLIRYFFPFLCSL